MSARATLVCLLALVPASYGQLRLPGDESAERFLKEEARGISTRFLDGAKTLKEWKDKLPRLRREYLDMLGLWPLPERTPLNATVTGTLTRDTVAIEKLHFQSKPGLYVTGNLYRPKEVKGKLPTVLYVCGHSGRGRDGNKTAFQDHGMWFARNGYVCLVIDTLQLGEIAGKHHGTYNLNRWWWHSLAYTPAGVECWNGIRAIDYLVSRNDVDADKIAVTGISGGGASTVWIAAADDRVKVAVPVSGMSDLESYVSNKVINGHCDCMFLVNLYRWEWTTILALIAPRPLLFANSDNDRIFPMDGNRRIITRLREAYKMHGQPDLVDEYVSKGGHAYRPDLRVAIFRWINKYLKGDTGEVKDATDPPLPGKQLRVFPEDKDLPADAINGRIDETFITKADVKLPEAGKFAEWQRGMLAKLREGPLRNLGDVPAAKLGYMETSLGIGSGVRPWTARYKTEGAVETRIRSNLGQGPREDLATLVISDGDLKADQVAIRNHKAGIDSPNWALEPRGVGELAWSRRNPPNYVERSYPLLGRTVDLGRVHDILATIQVLRPAKSIQWRLVGRGNAGILAAYAALLEPRITEVVVIAPPPSHRDGPHFLGVLRHLDIPDALGLLAPRKLTLIGAAHPDFDRTVEIYKLAGAADKLTRVIRPRLDPRGIPGTVTLSNATEALKVLPDAAFDFDNASLVIEGRKVRVTGAGKVTIGFAAGGGRPAKTIVMSGKKVEDLTALRRAARDRAEEFPSDKVRDPVVKNGSLVIVGGGGMPPGLVKKFVELAGGKQAKIVVLPTAVPNPSPKQGFANALRKAGAGKVTILPGNTPDKVESREYLDAMREATGIWFGGGRQWHFVDAYEHTKLLPLMHDVLKRGGVIGGSSAGATIQGEYLCRGGVFNNFDIAYEGYERGFAFLPGVAIDQHFAQRKRFADMTKLMKLHPQFLGIGLDEATAMIVHGGTADVVGRGQAHFYDAANPNHESLGDGGRYDLKTRRVIATKKE